MLKRIMIAIGFSAILIAPVTSWAKDDRWGNFSPREKEHILQNYQRWNSMPEKDKEQLKQEWKRYQDMPQDQRDQIRQKYEDQRHRRGR
jgi:hypothetical protein